MVRRPCVSPEVRYRFLWHLVCSAAPPVVPRNTLRLWFVSVICVSVSPLFAGMQNFFRNTPSELASKSQIRSVMKTLTQEHVYEIKAVTERKQKGSSSSGRNADVDAANTGSRWRHYSLQRIPFPTARMLCTGVWCSEHGEENEPGNGMGRFFAPPACAKQDVLDRHLADQLPPANLCHVCIDQLRDAEASMRHLYADNKTGKAAAAAAAAAAAEAAAAEAEGADEASAVAVPLTDGTEMDATITPLRAAIAHAEHLGASLRAIAEAKTALARLLAEQAVKGSMFSLEAQRPIGERAPIRALQACIVGAEKDGADLALVAQARVMKRMAEAELSLTQAAAKFTEVQCAKEAKHREDMKSLAGCIETSLACGGHPEQQKKARTMLRRLNIEARLGIMTTEPVERMEKFQVEVGKKKKKKLVEEERIGAYEHANGTEYPNILASLVARVGTLDDARVRAVPAVLPRAASVASGGARSAIRQATQQRPRPLARPPACRSPAAAEMAGRALTVLLLALPCLALQTEALGGMEESTMDTVNADMMALAETQLETWGALKAEEVAKDEEIKRLEAEAVAAAEAKKAAKKAAKKKK